ncbi:hypothetical protein DTO164E3_3415 [Paecilomyces variotii]|nr:hypothetical protein DTO032I3_6297 [Paecilomyces variotii]KAJ9201977.1 hypothetical protein DTO164E3_3415 [Paecilomyces variotii]KAJ9225129.1 hypothetical protein DTO169C6_2470 [Paecilomyces variotii]KAJ9263654.1 hypothetical protein DTO195F2_2914 [Paecilomyces variotii]KAJ9276015.1 hypothetical protein DTO021D3_7196 [Paecilomyces variotii]
MIDAQHAYLPPVLAYAIPLPPSPVESPSPCDSPRLLEDAACSVTAANFSEKLTLSSADEISDPPTCCQGESGEDSRQTPRMLPDGRSASPTAGAPSPLESPKASFEEFAVLYCQRRHREVLRRYLEQRLRATRVSIGLSARLLRVGTAVQKGLVDGFKHGDKANFMVIYNTIHEIQESFNSASRRLLHRQDPLEGNPLALDSERNHSPSFLHQLSPKSRSDLLEILNLVRTDPQFLFERISSLTPSRLSALVSSATALEGGDSVFASRTRNQFLFSKRTTTQSLPYKDHALAFERTDALSALLFNVFAPSLNSDSAESRLRLDVWSSTCAKLLSHGGSKHHSFVGYILSTWSLCSHWKIKPKFELYLMDVLQKGAFLLENVESPLGLSFDAEPPDPFRTDAAEEFFESAVETLFEILDDPEGGFPHGTLEMGRAIFGKLTVPETRDRFLDYMLVQWFFSKFLHNALCYPETHGLLLDFHISKDAREKLLGQIGLRAQSQVFRVLHSLPQFSMARPSIRQHVDSMISWFDRSSPKAHPELDSDPSANGAFNCFEPSPSLPSPFLILSAADILTILNALFPKSICASFESSSPSGMSSFSFSPPQSHSGRTSRIFESQLFQGRIDALSSQPATTRTVFSPDVTRANSLASDSTCSLVSQPRCPLSQNVDRIRFELESDDRPSLDHPMAEDWAVLLVTHNGRSLNWVVSHEDDPENDHVSDDGARSTTIGSEENYEALQTAIVKLVHEEEALNRSSYGSYFYPQQMIPCPLKQRFDNALSLCQQQADFIGAHYWWNASRQLRRGAAKFSPHPVNDSWILQPLVTSCKRSLELSCSIIERCESSFVMLDRTLDQLQTKMKEMTKDLARLRNKMWYMTDVKNSMRYEDAKHVALALKTMVYSASLQRHSSNEHRGRNGARSLAGSFLQKPEVQVMNVMKAPSSQGGPNKLSDEQVDLTRKWLTHHGIDNFCKGEERIHRFCYEVKSSINRLIGDTMSEAPVLWSSELFQKERAKYETSSVRGYPGISAATGVRPSSIASEDALYASQTFGLSRVSEAFSRPYNDAPSLARKSSFQSLASDKWRAPRDAGATDTSSIGDSPGRTASSSTADTYSTFWSAPHTQAQSAASASSFQSRPPSMFSDTVPPPRRSERNIHGKSAFLDELRQTLTSLLLSDLGSPVWSCGSETDAWFTNCLNQKRIQVQMAKRARIRKFLDECDSASNRDEIEMGADRYVGRRRSRSVGPIMSRQHTPVAPTPIAQESSVSQDEAENSSFPYRTAFFQLIESFSRHSNPFVKLKALRDLRTLVIASLCNSAEDRLNAKSSALGQAKMSDLQQNRSLRYSFSQPWRLRYSPESLAQAPSSPVAGSSFSSRQSDHLCPTESEIVDTLRTLLQDIQPKTLFRDLQFVSAFVPSEILNKTESGTAFLHFGLAALSLKDEVCNSMVEIADKIVSQELSRRHPPHSYEYHRPGHAIEDAAAMWIITAKEGNPVAQRELAILYLTHPELLPRVTLPLTLPRDTFKAEMMYRRDKDPKSDPQSMCLALHWMQLSANGGDELARNRLREREEFDSIA